MTFDILAHVAFLFIAIPSEVWFLKLLVIDKDAKVLIPATLFAFLIVLNLVTFPKV